MEAPGDADTAGVEDAPVLAGAEETLGEGELAAPMHPASSAHAVTSAVKRWRRMVPAPRIGIHYEAKDA